MDSKGEDRKAEKRKANAKSCSGNDIAGKMDTGNNAGQRGEHSGYGGNQRKNNRQSGIAAEPEESAGNQKCAGSMSAGEGASVLVLYQRDKMKELRWTGTIELFTNQGDQQKAGSGDCPKGGNPQPDLFLHKGRQRTDRADAVQKDEQHRQQAKAGSQTFLADRGSGSPAAQRLVLFFVHIGTSRDIK